ncbi:MAG: DUF480 domain-containing protein, partial [Planctomycetia bacterium]|nr:DUF480 domain-containing protein [Planctomycetia bacterium]
MNEPPSDGAATGGDAAGKGVRPLDANERRVLGVLIEKGKTTPDQYPLSLAGERLQPEEQPRPRDDARRGAGDAGRAEPADGRRGRRGVRQRQAPTVPASGLRVAGRGQGGACDHRRAALPRRADRGRSAGPGQPDGRDPRPHHAADPSRRARCQGARRLALASRPRADAHPRPPARGEARQGAARGRR